MPPPSARPSAISAQVRERSEQAAAEAERAGRRAEAGRMFLEIGAYEAATRCFYAAGELDNALHSVLRISKAAAHYADAAVLAIRLAVAVDRVDFDFDQFIARFLGTPPADDNQAEAFYEVAGLYERQGFAENACEVLRVLLEARPGFRDARPRYEKLSAARRGSNADFARVVDEDLAFREASQERVSWAGRALDADGGFPELPELPDRPSRSRASIAPPQRRPSSQPPPSGRSSPVPSSRARSLPPPAEVEPSRARSREAPTLAAPSPAPPTPAAAPATAGPILHAIANVFEIPAGFIVADRYRIERQLGVGGMAAVYRARDLELDETIAIKLVSSAAGDPSLLSRFKQELALCRKVTHPNVIRLYDIGTHGDVRFITMELLSGHDLSDVLAESRELTRDLDYLAQVCDALQAVHDQGVVHRDMKPENVFITQEGVAKLMDFGIAKRRSAEGNLTQRGFIAGTPAYMAPEQIQDFGSATHLADLYSIGVIAYLMFTGVLPFESEQATAILIKHLNEQPEAPSVHEPTIPDELEFIILQLLEKQPERRIQSCAELAKDLRALRERLIRQRASRPQRRG